MHGRHSSSCRRFSIIGVLLVLISIIHEVALAGNKGGELFETIVVCEKKETWIRLKTAKAMSERAFATAILQSMHKKGEVCLALPPTVVVSCTILAENFWEGIDKVELIGITQGDAPPLIMYALSAREYGCE